MNVIERIKQDGAAMALHQRINSLMYDLSSRNWEAIKDQKVFVRLGDAISDAENIIRQMRETLEALIEIEPENR